MRNRTFQFAAALLLSAAALAASCASRVPITPEIVRAFNQSIYDVTFSIPDGSVEFTNLRATEGVSAVWVDTFRTRMQKAGYNVVKDEKENHDLTTKVVFNCVDSTLTLQLSDKDQVIDEILIQEGLWLEACLNTRMADYVSTRLVNAITRSANVSAFAENLEIRKNPSLVQAPKAVVYAVPPSSDGRNAVAVHPFSGQGGTDDQALGTVTGTFASEMDHAQCMRVVRPEALAEAAKILELKDRCINETCQMDLARSARVDVLVRGVVSKLSDSYIVNANVIDITTRRILYSDKATATAASLAEESEKLARRIRRFVICPGK